MSKAVILVGLPGAGKTYLTRNSKILKGFRYISTDTYIEMVMKQSGIGYAAAYRIHIRDACTYLVSQMEKAISKNKNFVIDQTNISVANRYKKLRLIPSKYELVAVHCLANDKLIATRMAERGRRVPAVTMGRLKADYEPAGGQEGFSWVCLAENFEKAAKRRWNKPLGEGIPF